MNHPSSILIPRHGAVPIAARLADMARRAWRHFLARRAERLELRAIDRINDRMLADIGLSRVMFDHERNRFF